MKDDRYSRQEMFYPIGEEGQRKIGEGRVCLIGVGALGSAISNNLTRAGVGHLRIVDRDRVELSNLQRQVLFTEEDVKEGRNKAEAAKTHLTEINSGIEIEAHVMDVGPDNIEALIKDVDVVVDGTDNLDIRYLINEACHKHGIPWVYGGVAGSNGMVMDIFPGEGPCLECLLGGFPDEGSFDTANTAGIINSITTTVAAYETAETLKILIGSDSVLRQAVAMDLWENYVEFFDVDRDPDCPVCGKNIYSHLGHKQE